MIKGNDIKLTAWIGANGAHFQRVQLAFEKAGYRAPTPDVSGGKGAYVSNIANQFQSDLTPNDVRIIIAYATRHTMEHISAQRLTVHQMKQLERAE